MPTPGYSIRIFLVNKRKRGKLKITKNYLPQKFIDISIIFYYFHTIACVADFIAVNGDLWLHKINEQNLAEVWQCPEILAFEA